MLAQSLRPLSFSSASRRAYYSVFSSKPGGGRYFNSAKPQKVSVPATPSANSKAAKTQGDDTNSPGPMSSPSTTPPASSSPSNSVLTPPEEVPVSSSSRGESSPKSSLSAKPSQLNGEEVPRLLPHPSFSAQTYPLHQFFALHRPLLHLPLSTATLFTPPDNVSAVFHDSADFQQGKTELDDTGIVLSSLGHSEADTARQIVRAMAIHQVGAMIDWSETLARLGDRASMKVLRAQVDMQAVVQEELQRDIEGCVEMQLDSTKRKRRKKMSKHKLKKRRKATRAQRRRLGK